MAARTKSEEMKEHLLMQSMLAEDSEDDEGNTMSFGGSHSQTGSRGGWVDPAVAAALLAEDPMEVAREELDGDGDGEQPLNIVEDAVIYVKEGLLLQPLECHPNTPEKRRLWQFLHAGWFPLINFMLALTYLLLALIEKPAVVADVPYALPLVIQTVCLAACMFDTWLRFRRYGREFHWNVVVSMGVTFLLSIDLAIYVVASADSDYHILRALRPIYLLSTDYAASVRRVLLGIASTLSKVFDIIVLYFFYIGVFAVLGVYLFSEDPDNWFFKNLGEAYTQLFILLTTCNYPNVMMPAYQKSPPNFIFFFVFIVVGIYFLLNLLLAMVYQKYTAYERDAFRNLILSRRKALSAAFYILAGERGISRTVFSQFFRRYRPNGSARRELLSFEALAKGNACIQRADFLEFYSVIDLKWRLPPRTTVGSMHKLLWFERNDATDRVVYKLNLFVGSRAFDAVINLVVLGQTAFLFWSAVYFTSAPSPGSDERRLRNPASYLPFLTGFLLIYVVEAALKIVAFTWQRYWDRNVNRFDFLMTLIGVIGVIIDVAVDGKQSSFASALLVVRSFRLVRVLEHREAFQHLTTAAITILPRMGRFAALLGCVYYFFAIIGMTFFHDTVSQDCQYTYLEEGTSTVNTCGVSFIQFQNVTAGFGHYQLNNFDNIARSYVTLFELMVVNDWNNTMGGHESVIGTLARAFFMLNYVVQVLLVVNVVIAFVLEAFDSVVVGRSLAKRKRNWKVSSPEVASATADADTDDLLVARCVRITPEDAYQVHRPHHAALRRLCDTASHEYQTNEITYYGWTGVTSLTLFTLLYDKDIPKWIREAEGDLPHHGDPVLPDALLLGTRSRLNARSRTGSAATASDFAR